MTEQIKSFWFYMNDDYRSGLSIYAYTKSSKYDDNDEQDTEDDEEQENEEQQIPDGALEINFVLPNEGRRLYIVVGFPHYKSIWHVDIDNDDDNHAKLLYLKIFSQIHNRMPFQVTGYTGAYHEKGHYPHVPDNIKCMPDIIDHELVTKIKQRQDYGDYFLFVVDKYGNEVRTNLLNPI
jgi:hypothetical protein